MASRLTRSYALANLADAPLAIRIPAPAERNSALTQNAEDTELESDSGGNGDSQENAKLPVVKGKCQSKAVPQRSPLPVRQKCNEHPGLIVKPRSKRSTAEVTKATKQKAALQRQADKLEQQRIDMLAEMELQEELETEEEQQAVVRKLAASSSLDDMEDIGMSEDQEDNNVMFADADNDSGSEAEKAKGGKTAAIKGKQRKKAAKGEVQAAIDKVKQGFMKAGGKKRGANADLEKVGPHGQLSQQTISIRKKQKANFPSGLVHNWQSKISAVALGSSKATIVTYSGNDLVPGSLNDEDACADVAATLALDVSSNHLNDFVLLESASESNVPSPPNTPLQSYIQPKLEPSKPSKQSKSAASKTTLEVKNGIAPSGSTANICRTTSDINALPEFARPTWSTIFLSTLYKHLACSTDPFVIDSDLVKGIQEVVDIAYPGSIYHVRFNDKIFLMARDRLNEKRTYFGCLGIKIITDFFKGEAYANKPKAIAKYALWATRGNGPAIFGKPTPIGCTVERGSDSYIKPDGIFESRFIIQLLVPFLKWCKGSCHDYGRPVGALAMAATGIERAFLMNTMGTQVSNGKFSWDMVGTIVGEYGYLALKLSERCWDHIMELCRAQELEHQAISLRERLAPTQINRRTLYEPSSPIKVYDDSVSED